MTRRIGPTRAAGTVIVELEGEKPVEPGALGWVAYAGVLEKGDTGKLLMVQSQEKFEKKCGGYIDDSLLPDACFDYYNLARGAGGILLVRVTDGNEQQAEHPLYCRKTTQTPMGTIKAKNGGRWGGKLQKKTADVPNGMATDLTNTTIDTGLTLKTDEFKGGWVELEDVPNTRYPVVSNDSSGVVTVAADQTMKDDYDGIPGSSDRFYLYLENESKVLTFEITDGEENPDTEFGIRVYCDGDLANEWPNLSTDPNSSRYWIDLINEDGNNDEIEVVDLWTGAHDATIRPANHYGEIDSVTETVLTAIIHEFDPATTGDGNGTVALGTTTDEMVEQTLTITFSDPTTYDVESDKFGSIATSETVGSETTPNNKWTPPFTLTAGATAWEAADVATLVYKPFTADELIGGKLYPDKANAKREKYRITDNDHSTITVAAGSDLTASGAPGDEFMVVAPCEMEGGRDGNSELASADWSQQAWNVGSSPFNQIIGKNLGLVKFGCPGITEKHDSFSDTVEKEGIAYADAINQMYRVEIPSNVTTEEDADAHVNDTIGRNDFAVVSFPSYAYVADPEGNNEGKLKLVPCTGMIHGREARIAADYNGYHRAEAGTIATLPSILKLTTEDTILDEEFLNPLGIGVIKKVEGNFVMWGDRTLFVDPTWKWKHQREQMCYYENVLRESFDWIIFMINDRISDMQALTSLKIFFLPEWQKRAIRGDTFEEAAIIRVDTELNTDATRAAGDKIAEVKLRLADTTERFVIRVGKQGIFEAVAA